MLGRVLPGDGLGSLSYSLNGAAPVALSIGPDDRRLAGWGDFNADIAFDALREGANEVVLVATDAVGRRTERTVTLRIEHGRSWPLPYQVKWREARDLADAVQVVDGHWRIEPDGLRTVGIGYDRALALGDASWTDFVLTTTVTFHGYNLPVPGPPTYGVAHVALAARWPGHQVDDRQPHVRWYPLGATAEFRLGADLSQSSWRIYRGGGQAIYPSRVEENKTRTIEWGQTWHLKLRVDSVDGGRARYRTRAWRVDEAEPEAWDMDTTEDKVTPPRGGALLLAHHTDVTFGDIHATPIQKPE